MHCLSCAQIEQSGLLFCVEVITNGNNAAEVEENVSLNSSIDYSLDFREGHMKKNKFVCMYVCVRVKG